MQSFCSARHNYARNFRADTLMYSWMHRYVPFGLWQWHQRFTLYATINLIGQSIWKEISAEWKAFAPWHSCAFVKCPRSVWQKMKRSNFIRKLNLLASAAFRCRYGTRGHSDCFGNDTRADLFVCVHCICHRLWCHSPLLCRRNCLERDINSWQRQILILFLWPRRWCQLASFQWKMISIGRLFLFLLLLSHRLPRNLRRKQEITFM